MLIGRHSQQVGLRETTRWRILEKGLALRAYKIQIIHELKPLDLFIEKKTFNGLLIARKPPRSYNVVYKNKLQSIIELKG